METMQRELAQRVDRLEQLVIRIVAGVGAAATVLGLVLPLWHEEETDDGPATVRLLTAPFQAFGSTDSVQDSNRSALVMLGVGLAVLLLVQIGSLWLFSRAWGRYGTDRVRRIGGWLAGLSAAGSALLLLFWLTAPGTSEDDVTRGPGMWPMLAGAVLALVLVAGETLPAMWRHDD